MDAISANSPTTPLSAASGTVSNRIELLSVPKSENGAAPTDSYEPSGTITPGITWGIGRRVDTLEDMLGLNPPKYFFNMLTDDIEGTYASLESILSNKTGDYHRDNFLDMVTAYFQKTMGLGKATDTKG